MTTRITVIIPVFRAAGFIQGAIDSVLAQTVPCNLILVDDASPDDTVRVIREYAGHDPRVRILEQGRNQGPAAARNRAIAECETEWVALLDADDRMAPDRLEHMLALADGHDWDFIADDLLRVQDWNNLAAGRRHWRDEDVGALDLSLEMFVRENLLEFCGQGRELGFIKPLMRRDVLVRHNLAYDEDMRLGEDFDLYARALLAGVRFGMVDPQGYYAFDMPGSLSKTHKARDIREVWQATRRLWRRSDLTASQRSALHAHMIFSHKRWAWVRLIEAKHDRNLSEAIGAFLAPPEVVGELLVRLRDHFAGPHDRVRAPGEPA
ncbi:MAG: glycosyltransferase family 2 protein [Hyphomonadaceae bacterium]|nr:glycosyltransferase family 2 protein [Hyphomonadaceae bacterium]